MIDLTFRELFDIRDGVQALRGPIADLVSERRRIPIAVPHTDDIVAAMRDGLETSADVYEGRVIAFATDPALADVGSILGTDGALYFMRELIAAKLPAIVDRLRPDARRGMKRTDREAAIRAIDAKLRPLQSQREALLKRLDAQLWILREWRQQALAEGNAKARSAIESQQMDLPAEVQALRAEQGKLEQLIGPVAV